MEQAERLIPADALRAMVVDALAEAGVPLSIAAIEASVMVDADACGVPSHGVVMLARLLLGLREGRARANPRTRIVRDRGAACVFEADNGPGRWTSVCAMDQAVTRARDLGIGACLAVQTTHWGRAHAYAVHAARHGCIGLCTTNAIPTLAPEGATRAALGNNPLAIAVPRGTGDPLVLDIAMTQAAFGKVATHKREGRPIPDGWGVDADGRPTTDPGAILASGMLSPMGGHKGTGLALMLEILTAGLAGGYFGHEMRERDRSALDPDATKLFVAIEVSAFGAASTFVDRVTDLVTWVRASVPDGALLAPGERGWQARAHALAHGVPVHVAILEQLHAAGVTGARVFLEGAPR